MDGTICKTYQPLDADTVTDGKEAKVCKPFIALDTGNPETIVDGYERTALKVYKCDPSSLTMRVVGMMVECLTDHVPERGVLWKFTASDPEYKDSTYMGYGHSSLLWELSTGALNAGEGHR